VAIVPEREVWVDFDGNPLKFQYGDYVRIDISSNPARAHGVPFLEGYVRGYSLSQVSDRTCSAAYELFQLGNPPLRYVLEGVLVRAEERLPHSCPSGRECPLCGNGAPARGLSIFDGPKIKD
jgi:hypothetical protein